MAIKWYEHGKLVPDENSDAIGVFTIVKVRSFDPRSFERHRFFIGVINGETIDIVNSLSKTDPITFGYNVYLKRFEPLTHKDIINIKLNNVWITCHHNEYKWKYSDLKKFLEEDKIEFYQ